MTDVRGKRVLVVGLGRSGRAAALCLSRRGAEVTVTDLRPPSVFQAEIPELLAHKIGLELGLHREETFLHQDLIVLSPGVFPEPPALVAARERNVTVVPEIEAASWFLEGTLVGVTGTNGKTTTTALLGKILKASDFSTFVGGNIGVPLISAVDQVPPASLLVAELSSFQLEGIQDFRPQVAVLLNLTPNHLDRHPSFDAYVGAKARVFRNQTGEDYAILNADDPNVLKLAPALASRTIFFSQKLNLPDGIVVSDGQIRYRVGNLERVLLETREVRLRGAFNLENVLAAAAAACVLGADFEALRRAVREFEGVEHRLEYAGEIRGVDFYNDSKATSVDATVKALSAFERGVHLILGGKDKGAPYAPLRPWLKDRVRAALLIGAAADRIERELAGAVRLVHAGDLETAVRRAFQEAKPGEVVLLSPACASFDQFQDFEHRGHVFKEVLERLARDIATAGAEGAEEENSGRDISPPVASVTRPRPEPAAQQPPAESTSASPPVPEASEVAAAPDEAAELSGSPPGPSEPIQVAGDDGRGETSARPLELTYVYEVAAEECPPADFEAPPAFQEDAFAPVATENLRPPESVEDEPLPFETSATAGASAGQSPQDVQEGREPHGLPSGHGKGRARGGSGPQGRLPGI